MTQSIVIIGTGLTGLVQALTLNQFQVTLIGPEPSLQQDDRSTAILAPGIALLEKMNLWNSIAPSATPLVTMELIDGDKHSLFDAHEIDALQFGYNIRNMALKKALSQHVKKAKHITWHTNNATAITPKGQGWQITLDNNKTLFADLLIGADGRNSPVRQAAGIATEDHVIDQVAMVGVAKMDKPHFNTTVEWYRQGGPLTLVPMEDRQFAFVWCDNAEAHQIRQKKTATTIAAELSRLTQHRFGDLTLRGDCQLWPVRPFLARSLIAPSCALVGEAAHALPPIGAQGFNTSLQDIMALTMILEQGKAIGYPVNDPTLLQRYDTMRSTEVHMRAKAINTLNRTLLSNSRLPHALRRLSLNGLQRFDVIKKQIMHIGLSPLYPA